MENIESFKQRVALYLSCRQLKDLEITSKSDPLVEVQIKDQKGDVWCHLGSTEAVSNNRNPNFSTFIECDYYFEREQ